ncbi:MAG: hypothetical protein IPI83_08755 [Sphingomonadales bacterium]|nr:hypothetical protein [Sphingomonadales bacterium]
MPAWVACNAPVADWLWSPGPHLRAGGVDIADDAGLHLQRILKRADGGLPAGLRACTSSAGGRSERSSRRAGNCLIDLLDVVGDVLRLAEAAGCAGSTAGAAGARNSGRLARLRAWLISICAWFWS